jgi:hypothetical protein
MAVGDIKWFGQGLHDFLPCGNDFFANAVSGDGGDAVGFHGLLL